MLGIAAELAAKREALRASMEKRGASADALAKFPKMAEPMPPLPKRATLAQADRLSERAKKARQQKVFSAPCYARHARIKRIDISREVERVGHNLPPVLTARIKAIAGEVARAAGLQTEQILAVRAVRRGTVVKHMALYMVAELTKAPMYRIAEIFNYADHTSARYAMQRTRYNLTIGNLHVIRLYAAAKAAILQRWPEYEPHVPDLHREAA